MSAHPLKLVALGASILTVLLFQFFHLGRILDTGDGIAHYQVARDAIHNPELFLNTWGRPFFTLLMSIPSQFGMDAIILINILIATLTAVLLYQVAILLGINNGWLAAVLLITSQSTWNTIFAGLTEPLFLLLSVSSILLIVQNKRNFAYFLLGILTLTRPEAIIIAPLTFTIDIFHNRPVFIAIIKAIIFAVSLPLIYTAIGVLLVDKEPYFLFTSSNNQVAGNIYGFGNFLHFYTKRLEITSNAVLFSSLIGLILALYKRERILLLFWIGGFFIILLHSLLWKFGLLGSAGLTRMLSTSLPLICLVAVYPLNFSNSKWILSFFIFLIFFNHSYKLYDRFNYFKSADSKQEITYEFVRKLRSKEKIENHNCYVHWSFLRHVLEIELNDEKYPHLWDLKTLKPSTNLVANDIIIHDNFTGYREGLTPIEWLKSDRRLKMILQTFDDKTGLELTAFKVLKPSDTILTWNKGDMLNNNPRFLLNSDGSLTIDTRTKPYKLISQNISKPQNLNITVNCSPNAYATIQNNGKKTYLKLPFKGAYRAQSGDFEMYIRGGGVNPCG